MLPPSHRASRDSTQKGMGRTTVGLRQNPEDVLQAVETLPSTFERLTLLRRIWRIAEIWPNSVHRCPWDVSICPCRFQCLEVAGDNAQNIGDWVTFLRFTSLTWTSHKQGSLITHQKCSTHHSLQQKRNR